MNIKKIQEVWAMIMGHYKRNPIHSFLIEEDLKLSGTAVRDAVRELRRSGYLVGSISDRKNRTGGYYIIKELDDYLETRRNLLHRVESMKKTVEIMDRKVEEVFPAKKQFQLVML